MKEAKDICKGAMMRKKLTITIYEQVYNGLHNVIGRRRISRFIETTIRPHPVRTDLATGYLQMAADENREAEALEWIESTM